MIVTVKYSQGQTVSLSRATGNNNDRFEPSKFQIGYELSFPYSDPPEDNSDYKVWKQGLDNFLAERTADLRATVEVELQTDIDKFLVDNAPEA